MAQRRIELSNSRAAYSCAASITILAVTLVGIGRRHRNPIDRGQQQTPEG